MKTIRRRFVTVGILVCLFATGMAALLDYFKYQDAVERIVRSRVLVVGYGIDNSIEASLALGLSFAELSTLPSLLDRESGVDPLTRALEVFDTSGRILYSTQRDRVGGVVPGPWLAAASAVKGRHWRLSGGEEAIAGLVLKNNFNLTLGYLAMRYDHQAVERRVKRMGIELAKIAVSALLIAAFLITLVLSLVLNGFERDMRAIVERIEGSGTAEAVPKAFAPVVEELRSAIASADGELGRARAELAAGG